ncbi:hypothetical protein PQX77_014557 [Marasmius sp. AFHP31]|nr:hypothetical protein PQX77_014557 [Marasmius sp. AFHP31]
MHPDVRQFVDALKIPSYRGSRSQPDFLLEDLESLSEERRWRSKSLFKPGRHTLVINTSGSGKTRSLLEAMAQNWGFYFLCRNPRREGLGSSDMFEVFDRLFKEDSQFRPSHLYSFYQKPLPPEEEQVLADNVGVARRLFIPVLLSRLIIFRQFIELMISHLPIDAAGSTFCGPYYLRWLYLQLHPSILDQRQPDVFLVMAEAIRVAFGNDIDTMEYWVVATMEALQPLLRRFEDQATALFREGETDGLPTDVTDLFIVIDEAQDAAEAFPHAFRSSSGQASRPALRELVHIWGTLLPTIATRKGVNLSWTFIITGTGMSVNLVRDAISSTSVKRGPFSDFHSIGAFEWEGDQLAYIRKYVPQCILDTSSGKILVERMGFWLIGRYRFTAQFLALLLEYGYQQPNTLLNRYLKRFGAFDPTDCPQCILNEEEMASKEGSNPIRPFSESEPRNDLEFLNWGGLRADSTSLTLVQDITYKYVFTSALNQSLGVDNWKLVEYGFARMPNKSRSVQMSYSRRTPKRLKRAALSSQTKQNPVVDERLVLLSCAVWLNNGSVFPLEPPIYTLHQWLSRRLDSTENNRSGFEDYVAYAFLLAFGTTPEGKIPRFKVGEIFKFFGQSHSLDRLKNKKATLISVHHPTLHHDLFHCYHYDHGDVLFTEEGKIRGYPAALGVGDLDNNKLMDWLRGDQPQMFCFPPTEMGPDLIFVLKLHGDDDGAEDDLDDDEDDLASTFDPDRDSSTYVWVVVQVKTHSTTSLSKADTKKAVRSITPSQWWSDSKDRAQSDEDSSGHVSIRDTRKPRTPEQQHRHKETMELMDGLKCREKNLAGRHSVIRAVASFPSVVKFSRHFRRPKKVDRDAVDDETIDNERMDDMIPKELQDSYLPLYDEDNDAIMDDDSGQSQMQSMTSVFSVADGPEDPSKDQDPDGDDGHPLAWVNFRRIVKITKDISPTSQLIVFGGDKLERAKSKRHALRSTSPQSLQDSAMGGPKSPPPAKPSKRIQKATSRSAVHRPPVAGPSRPKNQLLGHRK